MILYLYVEVKDKMGFEIESTFLDEYNNVVATAKTTNNREPILYYNGKSYQQTTWPKKLKRHNTSTTYPLHSKRNWTLGFEIKSDDKVVSEYYDDAINVGKKFIFKKNVGFLAITLEDKFYQVYKVGYGNENWHNYCIKDETGNTVGIVRRFYGEVCKAKIYIEDKKYLLLALLVADIEIITYAGCKAQECPDPSAGNYISILKEEKEMYDKKFIARVEQTNTQTQLESIQQQNL